MNFNSFEKETVLFSGQNPSLELESSEGLAINSEAWEEIDLEQEWAEIGEDKSELGLLVRVVGRAV